MSKITITIGTDNTLDDADVCVTANHDEVVIHLATGEEWMGFKVLAEDLGEEEAVQLARRIAASPEAELAALGYDASGWLDAA